MDAYLFQDYLFIIVIKFYPQKYMVFIHFFYFYAFRFTHSFASVHLPFSVYVLYTAVQT